MSSIDINLECSGKFPSVNNSLCGCFCPSYVSLSSDNSDAVEAEDRIEDGLASVQDSNAASSDTSENLSDDDIEADLDSLSMKR